MAFAMANTIRVASRRSSSFSLSSSTAPNMADSGMRHACRKPKNKGANRLLSNTEKNKHLRGSIPD